MFSLNFTYEYQYWNEYSYVVGVDEVGRGALAGPVVAAAVVFPRGTRGTLDTRGTLIINDSKKLTAKQREKASGWIYRNCLAYGIGEASDVEINRMGIVKANRLAMRRAIEKLKVKNLNVKIAIQNSKLIYLVDGYRIKYLAKNQKGIVHGDAKCFSIAAASIIAKVYRDKIMHGLAGVFPGYGWESNVGYGTREHIEAIRKHGLCCLHRKMFVRKVVMNTS